MGEFLQRTARLDELLAQLAGKLNNNESFNPTCGFQVDVVFVSMPGPGSGRGKTCNPGRLCLDRENKKKQCIIPIKNKDRLCCARAIVTMRAHCHKDQGVDGFRDWDHLKRGRPVQQRQAQALHQQAGVAEGPCGLPELRQFQQALGAQYQLLVMTRMKPFFLIFKGPAAPHQIRLLKSNHHYDGCTSFPEFLNRSYYCVDCERGFNTNDRTNHACRGKRCSACGRSVARITCTGPNPPPIARPVMAWTSQQCQTFKTCLKCQAPYTVVPGKRHRCGYAKCPVCRQWVSIQDHKCYRFSSTFNLTELKKGFFPYLFNTPDHQQYVGRIPDLEFYDPEGMVEKKKQELER